MTKKALLTRRHALIAAGGVLFTPALIGRAAAAATRGVTDTQITFGTMQDLSGVTAVQGVNNANAMRLVYDAVNAKGGVHGRKLNWVLEDMQYIVPKAVQAMNKLLNKDEIFFSLGNGGTPHNDAVMPAMFEKNVPNVFPLTCARSMYEPFNRLKFGQFSSYYDQMRAAVKYFTEKHGKTRVGVMYQDTDYGKDVLAGAVAQAEALGLKMGATAAFRPTDTDFNAHVARLQDDKCDLVIMGTIVKDTVIILQTARKAGFNATFCGNFATYSTAVAEAPGEPAEGFYSMAPALYRYPDDPTPAVHEFCENYRKKFGIEANYLGEAGYTAATFAVAVLEKVGRDLTLESFIAGLESMKDWHDIFGGPALSMSPTNHHASSQSFLSVVNKTRWTPVMEQPLSY
jgi:branched-chain amino acid transport system substrate-binding protein